MKPITIRVSKKKLRAWKMLALGVVMIALVLLLDSRLRPLITTVSSYQAKLVATKSINDAVLQVLAQEDIDYDNIITISENQDGEVNSLETNMAVVNRLKSQINNAVTDKLLADFDQPIDLPIGTLLGGHFFSGRGPNVEFRILPSGYVETEIYNNFESAGINQTVHQIMLSVKATVTSVMPLYRVDTEISTNVCIAETVIVGKVPQSFTDINGDRRGILDQLNDYQAVLPTE